MARKSFLARIDGSGRTVTGGSNRRKGSGPSGMQVYRDVNNVLGAVFRMIGSFFGVDVDKYARKGGRKSVGLSAQKKVRKKKSKGLFATIGKGFN